MKRSFLFLLLALLGTTHASAAPQTIRLSGELTNTTGDVSAPVELVLTIDGEKVIAQLRTSPPLTGSGTLTGELRGGWCQLAGKLNEGFAIQLRGVINAQDFRGTYIAAVPGSLLQYGKFQLARESVAPKQK